MTRTLWSRDRTTTIQGDVASGPCDLAASARRQPGGEARSPARRKIRPRARRSAAKAACQSLRTWPRTGRAASSRLLAGGPVNNRFSAGRRARPGAACPTGRDHGATPSRAGCEPGGTGARRRPVLLKTGKEQDTALASGAGALGHGYCRKAPSGPDLEPARRKPGGSGPNRNRTEQEGGAHFRHVMQDAGANRQPPRRGPSGAFGTGSHRAVWQRRER